MSIDVAQLAEAGAMLIQTAAVYPVGAYILVAGLLKAFEIWLRHK